MRFRLHFAAILIFVFCIPGTITNASAYNPPQTPIENQAVISSPIYSQPAEISIPKINVSSSVEEMGLTKGNKMAVPNNFTEVGWFSTSAGGIVPGKAGNAVIGAHVDNGGTNPTTKGVFKNLHTLVPGDDIYITDTNGTVLHFKVTTTKVYAYNATETSGVFGASDQSHLNLITCYGTWLPSAGTYNKRLVVFTTLV